MSGFYKSFWTARKASEDYSAVSEKENMAIYKAEVKSELSESTEQTPVACSTSSGPDFIDNADGVLQEEVLVEREISSDELATENSVNQETLTENDCDSNSELEVQEVTQVSSEMSNVGIEVTEEISREVEINEDGSADLQEEPGREDRLEVESANVIEQRDERGSERSRILTPVILGKRIMMNTLSKASLHLASAGSSYTPKEDSPLYTTEKMLYDAQKSIALTEELSEAGKITTTICETVTFKGDVTFGGNGGAIAGVIEGNVVVEGHGVLYLTPSSQIKGNIRARNIIAEGKINGNIECERIIATSTAVLIGDVMYKDVFNPAPGAKVQGSLQSNPEIFSEDGRSKRLEPIKETAGHE